MFIIAFAGLSMSLLSWSLANAKRKRKPVHHEDEMMAGGGETDLPVVLSTLTGPALPLAKIFRRRVRLLQEQGKAGHYFHKLHTFLQKKILMAGSPGEIQAEMFMAIVVLSTIFLSGFLLIFSLLVHKSPYLFTFLGVTVGFALPLLWLSQTIVNRHVAILKSLPYFLDLLNLCLESGLDFTTAVTRIVARFSGTPIGYELSILQREIQMGRSRADSLQEMGQRIGLSAMTTVVNAIIQSEKLGSSIGHTLRIQAAESRSRRSIRAGEMALKAPVKLLFPLMIFIFPITFLIIFAPILISNLPVFMSFGK